MNDILAQAEIYRRNYAIICRSHYLASSRIGRFNDYLGVPVVVLTVFVGTSIFGTLNESPDVKWRIAAGLLSLTAAIMASLQTFLKFSERSDNHKVAGSRYAVVRRRLEFFLLKYSTEPDRDRKEALGELEEILSRLAELADDSPSIPDKDYRQAEKEFYADNPGYQQHNSRASS